jgi:hypothetical protein
MFQTCFGTKNNCPNINIDKKKKNLNIFLFNSLEVLQGEQVTKFPIVVS